MSNSSGKIVWSILLATASLFSIQAEAADIMTAKKKTIEHEKLEPTSSMPMWFYDEARDFRYPIPAHFDFAFIDKTGKVVISGPFGCARNFEGGISIVDVKTFDLVDGKWTVPSDPFRLNSTPLNIKGEIVDKYDLTPTDGFLDDYLVVAVKERHGEVTYAVVDKNWNEVSRFKATRIGAYCEGLIASLDSSSNKWGYIDRTGKQVITPLYSEARRFSEGLAAVRGEKPKPDFAAMERIRNKYANVKNPTPEQMAEIHGAMKSASLDFAGPAPFGFIDKTGKSVIQAQYAHAHDFHEGLAAVCQEKKWGFIDKSGATVIPFDYDWADDFATTADGKLTAVEKDGKVGFIDSNNKTVLPFEYADGKSFSEELAPVTKDGKSWGFIDTKGKIVIEPGFMRANKFNSGRALVYVTSRSDYGTRKEDAQYLFLTGKRALSERDLDKAVAAFNTAIKLAPGTPPARKSRYFLESAIPNRPPSSNIVQMLKEVEMAEAIGQTKEAQSILDKCFQQAPHSEWVAMKVSHSKINEGKTEEARKILDKMVEINNKYAPTYVHLARVAFANGDEKEAKRLIDKAHELNPYSDLVNIYYPFSPTKMKPSSNP